MELTCNDCIHYISPMCYKDPKGEECSGLGCSHGTWMVEMLKWKQRLGEKKQAPIYTVSMTWVMRSLKEGKKFKILKVR